jgi:hypothetical protein
MDNKLVDIILARLDKLEEKLDMLLEFKWKVVGGTLIMSLILTAVFQMFIALAERK